MGCGSSRWFCFSFEPLSSVFVQSPLSHCFSCSLASHVLLPYYPVSSDRVTAMTLCPFTEGDDGLGKDRRETGVGRLPNTGLADQRAQRSRTPPLLRVPGHPSRTVWHGRRGRTAKSRKVTLQLPDEDLFRKPQKARLRSTHAPAKPSSYHGVVHSASTLPHVSKPLVWLHVGDGSPRSTRPAPMSSQPRLCYTRTRQVQHPVMATVLSQSLGQIFRN